MKYKNKQKWKEESDEETTLLLDDVQGERDRGRARFIDKSDAVLSDVGFAYRADGQLVLLLSGAADHLVVCAIGFDSLRFVQPLDYGEEGEEKMERGLVS